MIEGMGEMEIITDRKYVESSIIVLRLKGNLDVVGADALDEYSEILIKDGAVNILLDLKDVRFLSSAGISSINKIYYALHDYTEREFKEEISPGIRSGSYTAPHLKLLNPSKHVRNALNMVGMDMYIGIYKKEKDAVSSFDVNQEELN